MATTQTSPQVALAKSSEDAVRALIEAGADLTRPSDSYAVLGTLVRVQSELTRVFEQYADWHAAAEVGVHHAGDDADAEPANPSWSRAEDALREAVEHSRATAVALDRAHSANGVASWYDEIRDGA